MKVFSFLAACVFAISVAFGMTSAASAAAPVPAKAPITTSDVAGTPKATPVHYRRYFHCHTRWRRVCRWVRRRRCVRWWRGRCRRWRVYRYRRCYRRPVRYCHGGRRWRRR